MFDRPGETLKTVAIIFTILGMIASAIYGVFLISKALLITGILTVVLGCLCCWISGLFVYAFGELVDNSRITVEKLSENKDKPHSALLSDIANDFEKASTISHRFDE